MGLSSGVEHPGAGIDGWAATGVQSAGYHNHRVVRPFVPQWVHGDAGSIIRRPATVSLHGRKYLVPLAVVGRLSALEVFVFPGTWQSR